MNKEHSPLPFTLEMPAHPHPAAENDAERIIEVDGVNIRIKVMALDSCVYQLEEVTRDIVRAVNNHDKLVEALEMIEKKYHGLIFSEEDSAIYRRICQAIAEAEK